MPDPRSRDPDSKLDRALEESFPGSDPVSISQPKPDRSPSKTEAPEKAERNNAPKE